MIVYQTNCGAGVCQLVLPLVKGRLYLGVWSSLEQMSCFLSEVAVTDVLYLLLWLTDDVLTVAWL